MNGDERGKVKNGPCGAVKGGYTIFLDEGRIRSFFEGGDFSTAGELDHFKDVGAQIEKRVKEGGGAAFLALAIGEKSASRDFAVLQIGHHLAKRGKSVLIVDCDFLHPGLSGIVENVEEHGFLDLLLYGSSLKTVSKSIGIEGVSVMGPGSFPVSRTIPFALKEFDKIRDFLRTKHDVVIYCSTLHTEDAKVNPLASLADGVILCCRIDEMGEGELEKSLKDLGAERVPLVELVCFCGKEQRAPVEAAARIAPEKKTEEPRIKIVKEAPSKAGVPLATPVIEKTGELEPLEEEGRPRVSVLRVVGIAIGVLVVAFVVWWAMINKTVNEKEPQGRRAAVAEPKEEAARPASTIPTAAESIAAGGASNADTTKGARPGAETGGTVPAERTGQAAAHEAGKAPDTLKARVPTGPPRYAIHVSSFKEMSRAEVEKVYLEKNGFSAQIVEVTLNDEKWLRVFVGAYATMEEAGKARLDLLGLSRIGYARIVQIENETR